MLRVLYVNGVEEEGAAFDAKQILSPKLLNVCSQCAARSIKENGYPYQKSDYEPMRKDAFEFEKEKYCNGYPDARSVQEIFYLITSFIPDSADKHIPSKTSRTVSSVPCITSEIRRKIRRRNKTHAKAKKMGSKKLRSKFETLRREIKDDVRKQHDLYVNQLVGDVKSNPREFYRYINSQQKKTAKVFRPG